MQCRPPDRRRARWPALQTTTTENRRQPAKQYWPIRRASNKHHTHAIGRLNLSVAVLNVYLAHVFDARIQKLGVQYKRDGQAMTVRIIIVDVIMSECFYFLLGVMVFLSCGAASNNIDRYCDYVSQSSMKCLPLAGLPDVYAICRRRRWDNFCWKFLSVFTYRRQSRGGGRVFTGVCLSVCLSVYPRDLKNRCTEDHQS